MRTLAAGPYRGWPRHGQSCGRLTCLAVLQSRSLLFGGDPWIIRRRQREILESDSEYQRLLAEEQPQLVYGKVSSDTDRCFAIVDEGQPGFLCTKPFGHQGPHAEIPRRQILPPRQPNYDGEKAKTRKYKLTDPVHPETVVRWFLDLIHYWFDESIGDNLFTGQRDAAFKYLCGWIETGEFPPSHTLLEIQVEAKFQEWLSSWKRVIATKCLAVQPNVDYATAERCTFDSEHKDGHSWEIMPEFDPANYTKPHVFDLDRQTGLPHVKYEICKCGLSKANVLHG